VNNIGDSLPSEPTSIIAATYPDAPNAPTLVLQDETTIEVAWTTNFNGGTPIDDYQVYWKRETDSSYLTFVLSTGNQKNHRVISGLQTGVRYDFKVQAKNDVGLCSFSPSSRFMAASVPSKPNAPVKVLADK